MSSVSLRFKQRGPDENDFQGLKSWYLAIEGFIPLSSLEHR